MHNGMAISFASAGSTIAGCTAAAAEKGVPSREVKDIIYVVFKVIQMLPDLWLDGDLPCHPNKPPKKPISEYLAFAQQSP